MATPRSKKEQWLKELKDDMGLAKSVIFADLHGLTVEESTDLRRKLRAKGVKTKVMKKTLICLAAKSSGYEVKKEDLLGQIAVGFSFKDEIAGFQELYKLSKKYEKIKLLGGIFEKKVIGNPMVLELSQLPSKEELHAKFIGSLKSPLSGLHAVLSGVMRGFVQVLKQISEKK